jgi:hypothetical protein
MGLTCLAAPHLSDVSSFTIQNFQLPVIVSLGDWQDKLRLSSDYGWTLDEERQPIRTERFSQRSEFTQQMRSHLQTWLQVPLS